MVYGATVPDRTVYASPLNNHYFGTKVRDAQYGFWKIDERGQGIDEMGDLPDFVFWQADRHWFINCF
jgi:hypothetical protein